MIPAYPSKNTYSPKHDIWVVLSGTLPPVQSWANVYQGNSCHVWFGEVISFTKCLANLYNEILRMSLRNVCNHSLWYTEVIFVCMQLIFIKTLGGAKWTLRRWDQNSTIAKHSVNELRVYIIYIKLWSLNSEVLIFCSKTQISSFSIWLVLLSHNEVLYGLYLDWHRNC